MEEIEEKKQNHQLEEIGGEQSSNLVETTVENNETDLKKSSNLVEITVENKKTGQEHSNNLVETTIENNDYSILEQEQLSEDIREESVTIIENENTEVGKVEENEKKPASLLKKPKAVSKQKHMIKPTVPQPFSLSYDRKMARDKQGGPMQTKESKSKLSKSISLNLKDSNDRIGTGTEQRSELQCGASITSRSTSAKNSRVEKPSQKGTKLKGMIQAKDVDSNKSQANTKDEEEAKLNKLKKSSTFKASPLPSFYHRKEPPPKPELKKVPVTRPKSPQLHKRSKSVSEAKNTDRETINKRASRTISITAKETIDKLLKGARKAPNSQQKEVVKSSSSVSRGGRMNKEAI